MGFLKVLEGVAPGRLVFSTLDDLNIVHKIKQLCGSLDI